MPDTLTASAALKAVDPAYQPWQRPTGLSSDLTELAAHLGMTIEATAELWIERAAIREWCGGMERRAAERAAMDDLKRMVR
jgi:hypothetical protein